MDEEPCAHEERGLNRTAETDAEYARQHAASLRRSDSAVSPSLRDARERLEDASADLRAAIEARRVARQSLDEAEAWVKDACDRVDAAMSAVLTSAQGD